jgi:hypothetical protein
VGDQLAMPAQNRVRRHEGCDVGRPTADLLPEHRESPPLIVGQSPAVAAQLRLQHAVLFAQELDDVSLLALKPAGQCRQD